MPLSDNPTIGPFLGRTRIAYFTMEIAIHVVGSERPSVLNELVMLYM